MHNYQTLIQERTRSLAVVRLNRPDKRNALNPMLIRELDAVLTELQSDQAIRAIIMTGEGKAFSSGMDLEILREISTTRTYEENLADSRTLAALFLKIHRHPKPIIAAVNGPAIAGGCGLATVCDVTIASEAAQFGYTEVRIGFVAAIVSVFLLRIIGEKRTRDLMLSGRIITAHDALAVGLVTEVTPAERLLDRAAEIAAGLSENSPASLAATKSLMSSIPADTLEAFSQSPGIEEWN